MSAIVLPKSEITVLAGVNGACKSSIGGAFLRANGAEYFNPDEIARRLRSANPAISITEANASAWLEGKNRLENAITHRRNFAFESTLGGKSITELLIRAANEGVILRIWYAGLSSVELHLARVAARVQNGGHDIPEKAIRQRWFGSQSNLIRLLPHVTDLRVFDNSEDGNPASGATPKPKLVLAFIDKQISFPLGQELIQTPQWAKPLIFAAYRHFGLG